MLDGLDSFFGEIGAISTILLQTLSYFEDCPPIEACSEGIQGHRSDGHWTTGMNSIRITKGGRFSETAVSRRTLKHYQKPKVSLGGVTSCVRRAASIIPRIETRGHKSRYRGLYSFQSRTTRCAGWYTGENLENHVTEIHMLLCSRWASLHA
jgi:hypothetical protein